METPTYSIGIDTSNKESLAYCLCRNYDNKTEIILAKIMNKEEVFEKEVKNLAKIFDATIASEEQLKFKIIKP